MLIKNSEKPGKTIAPFLLVAFTVMIILSAVMPALAQKDTVRSCTPENTQPFKSTSHKTADENKDLFMMLSTYHLAPYDVGYLDNALADLGRMDVSGIVYSTVGEITDFFARKKKTGKKGNLLTETGYNEKIFKAARKHNAKIWLQMRVYGNKITGSGENQSRTLTAEDILQSPEMRRSFMKRFRSDFKTYNKYYSKSCKVVLFEEAGIYHSPQGGGTFWSSRKKKVKRNKAHDKIFASRMAKIFRLTRNSIKKINPDCQVGIHLGHSVFLNQPVLKKQIDWLRKKDAAPDFMFYDFYLMSQRKWRPYRHKLTRRKKFITRQLKMPALHLAQLHTMNNFQHGMGRTPSKREIDAMISLDDDLGFEGIGFYTKNARKTKTFKNRPFAPNHFAQSTVYESSKDRWDYGMLKLREKNGMNYRHYFDLVLDGSFGNDRYIVSLKNIKTGKWDFIGYTNPLKRGRKHYRTRDTIVFRTLNARKFLAAGSALKLRFTQAGGFNEGYLSSLYILPSQPPKTFQTAKNIRRMIRKQKSVAGAVLSLYPNKLLKNKIFQLNLCIGKQEYK